MESVSQFLNQKRKPQFF